MRQLLPFILVLACPLMMIFMMRGMHGHGSKAGHEDPAAPQNHADVTELRALRDRLEAQIDDLDARMEALEGADASSAGSTPATNLRLAEQEAIDG